MLSTVATKGSAPSVYLYPDPANNRLGSGYQYDANGNLTARTTTPALTLTYDVENRMVQAEHSVNGSERYVYDPSNRRVEKAAVGEPTGQTYFYGVEGELLGTYTGGGYGLFYGDPWSVDVHFAGKKIWAGAGAAVLDRLGSSAFWAGYGERFYPYGQEITWQGQDFATYPRDTTTDLRYARNRYYSSTLARFTTPDPYRASGGPADPQSWNRYSYVQNDPVNANDPSGLIPYIPPIVFPPVFKVTAWGTLDGVGTAGVYLASAAIGSGHGYVPHPVGEDQGAPRPAYAYTHVADADDLIRNTISDLGTALATTAGAGCAQWLQEALAGSALASEYATVGAFLAVLPSVTGSAAITGSVGTNAHAVANPGAAAPGKILLFNTNQGFYKSVGSFVQGDRFAAFIGNVQSNTPVAREFLLIHELAHLFTAQGFRSDAGSMANQRHNNDLVWEHCGSLLMRRR